MDYLVIEGVKPWDGRYPMNLDASEFVTDEWGWIKQYSGYLPMTLPDGYFGGDAELIACLAIIALYRAGRISADEIDDVWGRFAKSPILKTVRLQPDSQPEEEASPPQSGTNGSESSSGDASTTSLAEAPSTGVPAGSGTQGSAISGWPSGTSGT